MTSLILPSRLTRQPQQAARIDWSNPLTRGLKIAINPAIGRVNAVTGRVLSTVSQPLPIQSGPAGKHLQFASGTAASAIITDYVPGIIADHSAFLLARSAATAGEAAYISTRQTANNGFGFTVKGFGSTGVAPNQTSPIRYTHAGIVDYEFAASVSRFGAEFVGVGFSATNGSDIRTFVRGAFREAKSTGTMSVSIDPIVIGGDPFYNQGPTVDLPLVLYWNRRLSDAEQASVAANPWQLFAAPQRQLFVANSAPAGSSYTLPAAQGSYTITGNAAGLRAARRLVASPGAYALTGNAANLRAARRLTAAPGAYAITGNAANLIKGTAPKSLQGDSGSYVITGRPAGLRASRRLLAAPGSYAITGFNVTNPVGQVFTANVRFNVLPRNFNLKTVHFSN